MSLEFVADEAIPYISESFSNLGDVIKLPASEIDRDAVQDADGLIVRSVTGIIPSLLDNSRVKFVGSATVGTDHIDLAYLQQNQIQFASAPGCSAITVAEFVLNSLFHLASEKGFALSDLVLGIIGLGNIGSALKKRAEILGISCLINDPPLQAKNPGMSFLPIEEVVEESDIISLHVPLTRSGKHPTYHLIDDSILHRSKSATTWINTSRGGVIDESALLSHRDKIGGLVLDVWENEPMINSDVVAITDIATAHIAGYSVEGKIRATQMVYEAACQHFGESSVWQYQEILEHMGCVDIKLSDKTDIVGEAILKAYDIKNDDSALRSGLTGEKSAEHFADLRNNYQYRREFSSCKIRQTHRASTDALKVILELGFNIAE